MEKMADFDPTLWLVEGVVNDPIAQFGSTINFGGPNVVAFADDELPPATGIGTGPFGDPSLVLTGQEGDIFTLIVTNFASGPNTGGDGAFDYPFQVLDVPFAASDRSSSVFDDDDLPGFYEVEEPLEIEPDDLDFLTGTGSVTPLGIRDSGNLSDPNLSDYWSIEFDEAGTITIQVLREEVDFDPALWIVKGVVNDPIAQFGSTIDFGDPNVVAFADDELPPATGGIGPFGDPSATLTGQEGDIFTLIVANFASGPNTGGDGAFDYTLTIS